MIAKVFFKSLIGLDISEAKRRLGYWWRCTYSHVNVPVGSYHFERGAGGRVELQTENNVVTSEWHNDYAELYY